MVKKKTVKKTVSEETKKTSKNFKAKAKDLSKNYWAIATVALSLILIITLAIPNNCVTGNVISTNEIGEKITEFLNGQTGGGVSLIEVKDEGSVYSVLVSYEEEEIPVYATKDGEYFIPQLVPTTTQASNPTNPSQSTVPKSDKPVVELFVMTHCPYGTQAEKGFLPMMKTLNNVADINIRFVHYFMHEEEYTETPIQLCIREKEGQEKFINYLECFLEGDGNADASGYIVNGNDPSICMSEAGINEEEIKSCVESGEWETYYEEDSKLSQEYGVQGSPTLIINGAQANYGRDAENYKQGVCEAFNNIPEVCNQKLDSTAPSVYFGWDFSQGSTASGAC